MVEARRSDVFADCLQRTAEYLGHSVIACNLEIGSVRRSHRPQIQQGLDNGSGVQPGLRVGNECHRGLVQILAESLVVAEYKSLVLPDGAARRGAKLVSLKRRSGRTGIEEVARVQGVVAQKLKQRAVPLIRAGLRDDADLAPRLLAVLGAIGVPQNVEFPHRVD